jgi:hypothetical protein
VLADRLPVDSELARYRGHRDTLTMQFQDHDNFPEFDHRALPPANGSSIGESARRPAFQGMPWKAGRHENWGIFNRHIWGVYVRHSQEEIDLWMTVPAEEALRLQRPLADDALRIVARGGKQDDGRLAA